MCVRATINFADDNWFSMEIEISKNSHQRYTQSSILKQFDIEFGTKETKVKTTKNE